ncbi:MULTISPECIES: oxalurate catabolism protein HpxX [Serratia]|jgi:Asp-tRNA(Asn)/Glu-tRNA(Gln) amidotransferase C subunit|uniref:Oxalurate catabolism protein HpxX n=1 Tax=Serratia liquefaciens TaxID=614 RepID=A0A380A0E8_SERLI|nr:MULTISPECIES: oxalurate catabolism protein HpxX [Serratia]AYO36402.1 oxalurate catabolism protein HpxX [Serratia sp. P2ACOL2]MBF8103547.1 oxalurate catabolism protein HpxX [Serratia liquefaciens]MBH2808998.1 oxalurate catabolism protein HpxX [Serratia liquefaciens]MBV0840363.1 oxalurate catabolism protein HpxX [Serratia liquefaciens]MCS4319666.1 Asp-tRNA(Asn)/Glu-tRNA(Gln) amidotransferase C subunit [Serratia sp. BIGb0234]
MKNQPVVDWAAYISQMEAILALEMDDARRQELLTQFNRIAALAEPLMAFPLDPRLEIAGVYRA